jgi:hypothetical protein
MSDQSGYFAEEQQTLMMNSTLIPIATWVSLLTLRLLMTWNCERTQSRPANATKQTAEVSPE